ncbi:MAG: hypothetical protein ACRD9L_14100 [Bryobacteraceae bacterium]
MMTPEAIAQAHDTLVRLLEAAKSLDQTALQYVSAALDVLCWILEHEHNPNFGPNHVRMERALQILRREEQATAAPAAGTVQ